MVDRGLLEQIGRTSCRSDLSVATNEYRGGEEGTEYHVKGTVSQVDHEGADADG